MRTYGLLVNPWTLATARAASHLTWPFRKLWCLLVGHSPEAWVSTDGSAYSWDDRCTVCGQWAKR